MKIRTIVIGAALLLAAGCSTLNVTDVVDHRRAPVSDFPKLDVLVTYIHDRDESYRMCGATANGCVTFNFAANQCVINLLAYDDKTSKPYVIAHADIERQCVLGPRRISGHCWRCLGYNSTGTMDTTDAWESYKRQRQ